jgi:hypothetical protein
MLSTGLLQADRVIDEAGFAGQVVPQPPPAVQAGSLRRLIAGIAVP